LDPRVLAFIARIRQFIDNPANSLKFESAYNGGPQKGHRGAVVEKGWYKYLKVSEATKTLEKANWDVQRAFSGLTAHIKDRFEAAKEEREDSRRQAEPWLKLRRSNA
jgi:hypothetical protein